MNTKNAELYLDPMLEAFSYLVDEIIIGDMDSSDATLSIAAKYNATVIHLGDLGYPEAGIQPTLDAATNDWILRLDADEILTPALATVLADIASHDDADVVYFPIRTWALARPINHGGFGPANATYPRFFKRGFVKHQTAIHGRHTPTPQARVFNTTTIPNWFESGLYVEHFSFRGVEDIRLKAIRYTGNEADQASPESYTAQLMRSLLRVPIELVGRYLHKRSYKDGYLAVIFAINAALYQADRALRFLQLKYFGSDETIALQNDAAIEKILSSWPAHKARSTDSQQ